MDISAIVIKMTEISCSDLHDINHFMKVWAFARAIGERELFTPKDRAVLEIAAIVHDIACPLCREKYGSAPGRLQEQEGMPLTRDFLEEFQLEEDVVERVVQLVGRHHTTAPILSPEHRILLEADLLVNAHEGGYSTEKLEKCARAVFATETGLGFLRSMYPGVKI